MPTTTPRLSGELFIISLEIVSLYLQHDTAGLSKKLDALDDYELKVVRLHLTNLSCYLRDVASTRPRVKEYAS